MNTINCLGEYSLTHHLLRFTNPLLKNREDFATTEAVNRQLETLTPSPSIRSGESGVTAELTKSIAQAETLTHRISGQWFASKALKRSAE